MPTKVKIQPNVTTGQMFLDSRNIFLGFIRRKKCWGEEGKATGSQREWNLCFLISDGNFKFHGNFALFYSLLPASDVLMSCQFLTALPLTGQGLE